MQLFIGETIKRLRQQKGITQETLAEYMHVSAAAVSKWERNETLPDISMVIPLASYFGVSTDEILGLNHTKNEKAIQAYLAENQRLAALGKAHERFDLISRAYGEFPNDWRIVEAYMWQLNYDPNCTEPYGNEVHKDELHRLCRRVLDECHIDATRYAALSILGGLYLLDGDSDKAIETARRFPDYWMTSGEEIEHCFAAKEEDNTPWLTQLRENIWDLTCLLQVKIRNAALHAKELDSRGRIKCYAQAVTLIKTVFDEEDFGFFHQDLSDLYLWIANRYVMLKDLDLAFKYYELGFRHAKAYDDLPKITTHTSFLVRGKVFDKSKVNSDIEANMVKWQAECLRSWGIYEKVKDTPQMQALLTKYEPFMADKATFS
ncbi:MAG: helix-turn-helix transcriptional regulator [Ruminococcaceae bacterium]|nr:helix-turn-helix transcriptional regulator [Oscillospiraceae bacterium]